MSEQPGNGDPEERQPTGRPRADSDLLPPEIKDVVFACLANHRRRILLDCIAEEPDPVSVDEIARRISEREDDTPGYQGSHDFLQEITISLVHQHLPKLGDAQVLEVDQESNTVRKGDRFPAVMAYLRRE